MTPELVLSIARSVVNQSGASYKATLDTTDATATVIASLPTDLNTVGLIEYQVLALKDDGATAAAFKRIARYVNDGTTLTLGTEVTVIANDSLTVTVALNVNSLNVELKVTGVAATNIRWSAIVTNNSLFNLAPI